MENTQNQTKTAGKREVFVTMGCAKYPYDKIKELFGNHDKLTLTGLIDWQISDDEKVQLIQEMDFLPLPLQRVAAFKFTADIHEALLDDMTEEERKIIVRTFELLKHIYSGELEYDRFEPLKTRIQEYIDNILKPRGVDVCFRKIAALEALLALGRRSSKRALKEVSSIQRDVLGEEQGTRQLYTIQRLVAVHLES